MNSDEEKHIDRIIDDKLDSKIEEKIDEKLKKTDEESADLTENEPNPPGSAEEEDDKEKKKDPIESKIEAKVGKRVGEKSTEKVFTKSYVLRESMFVLLGRIFLVEILFSILYFVLTFLFQPENNTSPFSTISGTTETSDIPYFFSIFAWLDILNLIVVTMVILVWYNRRYIISPQEVYYVRGILIRRKDIFHIQAMVAVRVYQGVIGRIFNFGNILLESPLLKKDVVLKHIQKPAKHAQVIENQRVKSIKSIITESVIPKPS